MPDPYAEDVNYWLTGTSSPDTWIERTKREIVAAGGVPLGFAYGEDAGRSAYMLQFRFGNETFRAVWPVLTSRAGNEKAARIQAATMLYHDVKARCVSMKVLGARAAFFTYLLLPDGRTAAQLAAPELADMVPKLLGGG